MDSAGVDPEGSGLHIGIFNTLRMNQEKGIAVISDEHSLSHCDRVDADAVPHGNLLDIFNGKLLKHQLVSDAFGELTISLTIAWVLRPNEKTPYAFFQNRGVLFLKDKTRN